jgi:hypothetical protein
MQYKSLPEKGSLMASHTSFCNVPEKDIFG